MGQKDPNKRNNVKFSKERVDKILTFLREGRHVSHAAIMSGITLDTLNNWIKWSDDGDRDFRDFGFHAREAKAIGETMLEDQAIALCHHERKPDAKTLLHILATKNRAVYGEQQTVELTGKVDIGIADIIRAIDEDEAQAGKGNG